MDAEHLKRILIVDDESDVTELLDYKFKQAGYAIRTLNDPLRAIGLARDFRPDLIILDVMMPELTGVQLLRMVRADALLQDTPVIFLTAKSETVDKVKGLESGADDYVTKPFDTRELMLRAQALLRRAKSAAAKPSTRLAAGALMLDIERHEVTASGKIVELTVYSLSGRAGYSRAKNSSPTSGTIRQTSRPARSTPTSAAYARNSAHPAT
jgi:two-component system phosphate regulon response regulator PhoB